MNTCVACHTLKTLHGVLSPLFLIHSFSTLLIILFLISLVNLLYSTVYLLFFVLFLKWCSLRSPQTISMFSRQNIELFGEYIFRNSCAELSYEKDVLKNFAKSGKHLCQSLLFNKVAGWKPPTLSKRDARTDVVLWILRNLHEHLFYGTSVNSCFCILPG